MQINVSTLLRDFPRARRIAFTGEPIIIKTRDGNLVLTAEKHPDFKVIGAMHGTFGETDFDLTQPTAPETDWTPSL
jgi:hypothetical protein